MLSCLVLSVLAQSGPAAPMRVTGAYFRMHDPAFVAQLLFHANAPGMREAARSVLTPGLLAARPAALERYRSYLAKVVYVPVKKPGAKTPAKAKTLTGPNAALGLAKTPKLLAFDTSFLTRSLPKIGDLGLASGDRNIDRDLGTAMEGSALLKTQIYGVASKDVTLTMPKSDPNFSVDRVRVFNGRADEGSIGYHDYSSIDNVRLAAGQDWEIDIECGTFQPGAIKGTCVIDDGAKNTINLRANIIPSSGNFAFWLDGSGKPMTQLADQTFKLHVHATSNGGSQATLTGSSDLAGVTVDTKFIELDKGGTDTTVLCTVHTDRTTPDATGNLTFVASAFDGRKSVRITTGLVVHTVWTIVSSPPLPDPRGLCAATATLRCANNGYWCLSATITNLSAQSDVPCVVFDTQDPADGYRPEGAVQGYLKPNQTLVFTAEGADPAITRLPNPLQDTHWGLYGDRESGDYEGWFNALFPKVHPLIQWNPPTADNAGRWYL